MSDEAPAVAATEEPHKIVDNSTAPENAREAENNEVEAELSQTKKNAELSMDVKVASPFKTYYEGSAFSVSAENQTGPFDILPKHHNFISLLSPCDIVVRGPKGEQKIKISGGIMHVKADKLIVFLDV